MDCPAAKDWLLLADDPARVSPEVADHLSGCATCRDFAAELTNLESSFRSTPTPTVALTSRDAFLHRVAAAPRRRQAVRRFVLAATALAACLVVSIALASSWWNPEPTTVPIAVAQSTPPVVEELVEWNLSLTEAESPKEREQLIQEHLPQLQSAVQASNLSSEDRAFAERLLAQGRRMGESADPVEEAESFHNLADTLLVRLDTSADDPNRSEYLARMYSQVVDRGVDANLARAEGLALKAEKQARVQNLRKAHHRQAAHAAELADRVPEKAREHVRPNRPRGKGNFKPVK